MVLDRHLSPAVRGPEDPKHDPASPADLAGVVEQMEQGLLQSAAVAVDTHRAPGSSEVDIAVAVGLDHGPRQLGEVEAAPTEWNLPLHDLVDVEQRIDEEHLMADLPFGCGKGMLPDSAAVGTPQDLEGVAHCRKRIAQLVRELGNQIFLGECRELELREFLLQAAVDLGKPTLGFAGALELGKPPVELQLAISGDDLGRLVERIGAGGGAEDDSRMGPQDVAKCRRRHFVPAIGAKHLDPPGLGSPTDFPLESKRISRQVAGFPAEPEAAETIRDRLVLQAIQALAQGLAGAQGLSLKLMRSAHCKG